MIELNQAKDCSLMSQEIYDIISNCLDAADDDGFLDQFVFERALVCYEVLALIEDLDEGDEDRVKTNPLKAFDHFIEMGYVDSLIKNHKDTVDYVGQIAAQYFEAKEEYSRSLGAVINKAQIFSSEILQNMAGQVSNLASNKDILETLRIADEWGMNRIPPKVENPVNIETVLDEGLKLV